MPRPLPVVIVLSAERDLLAINKHIAADSPANAARFLRRLRTHIGRLGRFPYARPVAPESPSKDGHEVRHLVHGRYRVLYFVHEGVVFVIHVRHARQERPKL